jgi:hypothetical protein
MTDAEAKVAELERRLLAVRWDDDDVLSEMRVTEARVLVEVAEARDDAGRQLYATEKVRQAAVTARLADDSDYQTLRARHRELKRQEDLIILEINEIRPRPSWPPPLSY